MKEDRRNSNNSNRGRGNSKQDKDRRYDNRREHPQPLTIKKQSAQTREESIKENNRREYARKPRSRSNSHRRREPYNRSRSPRRDYRQSKRRSRSRDRFSRHDPLPRYNRDRRDGHDRPRDNRNYHKTHHPDNEQPDQSQLNPKPKLVQTAAEDKQDKQKLYTKVLTPINVDNDNQDTNDEDDVKQVTPQEEITIQKLLDDDEQPILKDKATIWGDINLPPPGTDPRHQPAKEDEFSKVFLKPTAVLSPAQFQLNNRLIAQSRNLSLNTVPYYYHWCPGMFPNIGNLLNDSNLLKKRIRIQQSVQVNFIGMLIGPKGSYLKKLEEQSNCRIFVKGNRSNQKQEQNPYDADSEDAHVLLVADNEKILMRGEKIVSRILYADESERNLIRQEQQALIELNDKTNASHTGLMSVQQSRQDNLLQGGAAVDESMMTPYGPPSPFAYILQIPNECVGLIIGKGGETIRNLQAQTGAKVQIAKKESQHEPHKRNVFIEGPQEKYDLVKKLIEEICELERKKHEIKRGFTINPLDKIDQVQRHSSQSETQQLGQQYHAGSTTSIPISNELTGVIIGKQGEMVKFLQKKYNVNIFIPRQSQQDKNDKNRMIELSANDPANDNPNHIIDATEAIKRLIKGAQVCNEELRSSNRHPLERSRDANEGEKGSGSGDCSTTETISPSGRHHFRSNRHSRRRHSRSPRHIYPKLSHSSRRREREERHYRERDRHKVEIAKEQSKSDRHPYLPDREHLIDKNHKHNDTTLPPSLLTPQKPTTDHLVDHKE